VPTSKPSGIENAVVVSENEARNIRT